MRDRTDLQTFLELILGLDNVYFQPPESVKLKYPCIIYKRIPGNTKFADNIIYNYRECYTVTLVEKNPDSPILIRLINVPMCTFDRPYIADNLYHNVFNLYY